MITRTTLPPTLGFVGLLLLIASVGPNALLAVCAIAVLFLGSWLLWRPGESPILLFVFGFQWLQASTKIFHANWLGVNVDQIATYGGNIQLSIVLSLTSVAILALGMRLGALAWSPANATLIRQEASAYGPNRWFRLYVLALLVATFAQAVAYLVPGLTQPLLAVASIKWALYWVLAYATFSQPYVSRRYFLVALGIELLIGIGGYFSDFRTPLFFALFAIIAAGIRLSPARRLGIAALAALLLAFALIWTAVKSDFRFFASGSQVHQVVIVDYVERMSKLSELVRNLDGEDLTEASSALMERVAYVDFFSVVLDRVPGVLPHEKGALWWHAIKRPFMPRLFFPEKRNVHDTVRTNYYTGLNKAGLGQGTSFSLGYVAESYIDFGIPWMMVPIFAIGWILGRVYRWMLELDRSRLLLGMGLATSIVYVMFFLESSIAKSVSSLVLTVLVSWAVLRYVAPFFFPRSVSRLPR